MKLFFEKYWFCSRLVEFDLLSHDFHSKQTITKIFYWVFWNSENIIDIPNRKKYFLGTTTFKLVLVFNKTGLQPVSRTCGTTLFGFQHCRRKNQTVLITKQIKKLAAPLAPSNKSFKNFFNQKLNVERWKQMFSINFEEKIAL